jgi:hypothetical protein
MCCPYLSTKHGLFRELISIPLSDDSMTWYRWFLPLGLFSSLICFLAITSVGCYPVLWDWGSYSAGCKGCYLIMQCDIPKDTALFIQLYLHVFMSVIVFKMRCSHLFHVLWTGFSFSLKISLRLNFVWKFLWWTTLSFYKLTFTWINLYSFILFLWDIKSHSLVKVNQHFRGTYCLHLHSGREN